MNILALPAALAFTMNLTLCLIVLSSNPRDIPHRLFACFVLSFATWDIGEVIMITSPNPVHAIFGVKVIFAGLTFAPLFFLHFSFVFPLRRRSQWAEGWRLISLYFIPVAILVTFLATFEIDEERFREMKSVFYYGLLLEEPLIFLVFIGLVSLFWGMCTFWGIKNLIQSLRTTRIPRQKLQIKYLIFGIVSMAIAGAVINLLNYFFQLKWPVFFLASLYSLLVSLFFAIALIRYRLLDIHLIIRGGIVYSIVSGLILAIYILIIKNIGEAISRRAYGRSLWVESAMILALVFLFLPVQRKVGDWIDRFFYMERVRFRTKLSEFGRTLTELIDLGEVGKTAVEFITQTFHVDSVAFFFLQDDGNAYREIFGRPFNADKRYSSQSPFTKRMKSNGRPVDLEHLREETGGLEEIEDLVEKGWVLAAPILLKEKLVGFLLLGRKRNQKDYTEEEIELLEAFLNQVALAVSRALAYRDMSLKDKQILQAEKMAAIGQLAAGFAHEIRNPLGIITASAETLQKRDQPNKIREEMTRYILEESKRINGLITHLLNFAKPKEPQRIHCDLREVLEKTLLLLAPQAHSLGVEIKKEIPPVPIRISADPEQMRQAFTNLGVNALEAMPQGGLLSVAIQENAGDKVIVQFSDTGKGVPKEMRSKVFDPFFTTKEGGTGLGLSIAHRIVVQHGGDIVVEEGCQGGSTFTISLPVERRGTE